MNDVALVSQGQRPLRDEGLFVCIRPAGKIRATPHNARQNVPVLPKKTK